MGEKEYLTKEKFEELKAELEDHKTVKRQEMAEHLEYARSLGDLAENAEYHQTREDQAKMEARILLIEHILKNAEIISHKKNNIVSVGSKIVVTKKDQNEKITYWIVGSEEADVMKNKISVASPLGHAVMGKTKGDAFSFETPKGKAHYTILEVE